MKQPVRPTPALKKRENNVIYKCNIGYLLRCLTQHVLKSEPVTFNYVEKHSGVSCGYGAYSYIALLCGNV